jgi:hypothetical protein
MDEPVCGPIPESITKMEKIVQIELYQNLLSDGNG